MTYSNPGQLSLDVGDEIVVKVYSDRPSDPTDIIRARIIERLGRRRPATEQEES
jgi:hypothetical protein